MTELIWQDATAQAAAISSGAVSAAELLGAYLARIDGLDGHVRAYVNVDRAPRHRAGPFAGVPISVKDVEDVAGLPTTHSCELLSDHVAADDGPVAARLRAGGFALLGKTNVPEFCSDMTTSKLNGTARNPWDLDRTPGGSSGGAAAALAAGMCALAHGTDGAGSVRVPASFCGVVGLKPTRGLIAFGPDVGSSFFGCSEPGLLTRSVRDAVGALDVLAPEGGWTPARPPAQDGPLRIGVCTTFLLGDVEPECASAAEATARRLESMGHAVDVVAPRWEVLFGAVGPLEVPGPAALVSEEQAELVEPRNREGVRSLAQRTVLEHHRWVDAVRGAAREFEALWDAIDVLVTPTCGWLPPRADWARWDDTPDAHMMRFASMPNFAQPFNLSGQPAISLPLGWSGEGLPIGVQLVGRKLEESTLLHLAADLEAAQPWLERTVDAGRALV